MTLRESSRPISFLTETGKLLLSQEAEEFNQAVSPSVTVNQTKEAEKKMGIGGFLIVDCFCLLFVVCCLLFVVCCLLFVVC